MRDLLMGVVLDQLRQSASCTQVTHLPPLLGFSLLLPCKVKQDRRLIVFILNPLRTALLEEHSRPARLW